MSTRGSLCPSSQDSTPTTCDIWSCTVHPGHSVGCARSCTPQACPRAMTACVVWAKASTRSWRRAGAAGSGDMERAYLGCGPVSYTHLRAHETVLDLVCRLLLEKK